jgi:O-antigen ligase
MPNSQNDPKMTPQAQGTFLARAFDRENLGRITDGLAAALAASLPWSTSATGILAALLLVALIATFDAAALRRELATLVGGLPILLWVLGLLGMLWADVPLAERVDGLGSFHKLLFIPLLMMQFRRSSRGLWVLTAFLISCSLLLILSWMLVLLPGLTWRGNGSIGVPVKDYISQGVMFAVCMFVLDELGLKFWRKGRRHAAIALHMLAFAFLANILLVLTSRTALVVVAVLLMLFALTRLDWKRQLALIAGMIVLAAGAWIVGPSLRGNVTALFQELATYRPEGAPTRAGERLVYWSKSLPFIASAPIIGHGTGSIIEQYRRSAIGQSGTAGEVSSNPHNQTLAVAIQLGVLGTALLWAMWIAHLWLFRVDGLAAWVGLVVVVQNVVGSLFNSHLFDFTHGWLYVIAVGVAGGMVQRNARQKAAGS